LKEKQKKSKKMVDSAPTTLYTLKRFEPQTAKGYDSPALSKAIKYIMTIRAYENIDAIKTTAEYRTAIRHLTTDIANGKMPLKKASQILASIKEIRSTLVLDINVHLATGRQMNPEGETASWSVPQEEKPKAAKPKADPKPLTEGQVATGGELEVAKKAKRVEDLKARINGIVARYEAEILELEEDDSENE